jgi:hypothetical protein
MRVTAERTSANRIKPNCLVASKSSLKALIDKDVVSAEPPKSILNHGALWTCRATKKL